ncbi:MAG: phasin family protein [Xanthomonadales bacterium]|nr:phasin family protein [Xanthomonadales bacterium]
MYEQIHQQFSQFNKQIADAALKAHAIALEGVERALELQLKTMEEQLGATMAFFNEAAEARNLEAWKTLWPKGAQLVKEATERALAAGQELFGLAIRTGEAFGELAKGQIEAVNGQVKQAAKKAAPAAK